MTICYWNGSNKTLKGLDSQSKKNIKSEKLFGLNVSKISKTHSEKNLKPIGRDFLCL